MKVQQAQFNLSFDARQRFLNLAQREKVQTLVEKMSKTINKEIAQQLNISTPTAIFHRNNICEKLQTRSIGKLTVYAVLSGLVDLKEI